MNFLRILFALVGVSSAAMSEVKPEPIATMISVEGLVKTLGNSFDRVTTLTQSTAPQAKNGDVPLCPGDFAERINRITGMTVQVRGVWTEIKNKAGKVLRTCLIGNEFVITKTPAGVPLVGELVLKDKVYSVKDAGGQEFRLASVSPGLSHLVGKKVIIDARETAQKQDKIWTVVTYSVYP